MAVLSDTDRATLSAQYQSECSARWETLNGVTKADIRAALNAVDAWVDGNATSYNQAIPQPARNNLTAKQKAQLLMHVVRRRFEVT